MLWHEDNKKQLFVNCISLCASLQGLLCAHIQSLLPQCTVLCYISKNFYRSWQIFREFFGIIYHLLSGGIGFEMSSIFFFFHFLFCDLEVWMFQRMSCSIILIFISNSNSNPDIWCIWQSRVSRDQSEFIFQTCYLRFRNIQSNLYSSLCISQSVVSEL